MEPRRFLAAQLWYGLSQGVAAFINPFLNLFFLQLHFSGAQIGLLSALRPWISAPCGSMIAALADHWQAHRAMLVGTFAACIAAQGAMAATSSFPAMLALTVVASAVWTPSSIIADAAVMAASTHPGDYGRARTWASLTWTLFSPIAGLVNARFGIRVGILCYAVGSTLAIPTALALPVQALRQKVAPVIERAPSAPAKPEEGVGEDRRALLAEEGGPSPVPTAAPRGAALSRALAIVRYIEAITEMGVAPPTGAQIYGFAELSTPYAARHLDPSHGRPLEDIAEEGQGMLPDTSYQAVVSPLPPLSPTNGASPHATSLPRPVSVDSLVRVASIAKGIPRIRTRPEIKPAFDESSGSEASFHSVTSGTLRGSSGDLDEEIVFRQGLEMDDAVRQAQQAQHAEQGGAHPEESDMGLLEEGRMHGGSPPGTSRSPFSRSIVDLRQAIASTQTKLEGGLLQPAVPPPPPPADILGPVQEALQQGQLWGLEAALQSIGDPAKGGTFDSGVGIEAGRLGPGLGAAQLALDGAPSASLLLEDIRNIHPSPPPSVAAAVVVAAAAAAARQRTPGAPDSAAPTPAPGGSARGPGSSSSRSSGGTRMQCSTRQRPSSPLGQQGEEGGELRAEGGAEGGAELPTPGGRYRSAALRRLAEIFGGARGRGGVGSHPSSASAAPSDPSAGAGAHGSGRRVPLPTSSLGMEAHGLEGEGPGNPEAGSALNWGSGGFYTPVRRYIEYRKGQLLERRRAGGTFPQKPPSPNTAAVPLLLAGPSPGDDLLLATAEGVEGEDAGVTPELMREALQLESTSLTEPAGSLVISMLSKKLERMARKRGHGARRRQGTEREAASLGAAAEEEEAGSARAREQAAAAAAEAGRVGVFAAYPAGPQDHQEVSPPRAKTLLEPSLEAEARAARGGFWSNLGQLLVDPEVATFFLLATLMGFGHGVLGSYLFLFLSKLGGSEALMGYVLTANALPELPVFFFFGSLLQMLGMHTLLLVSAATLGLRLLAYLALPSWGLYWVLPIETLHAVTFACGWSACAINSGKISPPGLESTTQGIFQGLWTGVGSGTGGLVGGLLYHHLGPEALFRLSGLVVLAGTAACALVFLLLRWRRKALERKAQEGLYERLPDAAY